MKTYILMDLTRDGNSSAPGCYGVWMYVEAPKNLSEARILDLCKKRGFIRNIGVLAPCPPEALDYASNTVVKII